MLPLWKAWPDLTVDWLEMARRPMRPMRLVRSAWVGGDASAAFPGLSMEIVVIFLVLAIGAAILANNKGHSGVVWFLI
jgi:hypothetical protein